MDSSDEENENEANDGTHEESDSEDEHGQNSKWKSSRIMPPNKQECKEAFEKKYKELVAGLTVKRDSIAPCMQKPSEWRKISTAVDSGAIESVIDAEAVPGYEVRETPASKAGVTYVSATGEDIPNLGEVILPFLTNERTKRAMKMQAAEVTRPLASVKRICEAGHTVVFDEGCSFIYNKTSGEVNYLREDAGNYMFDVWVPPSSETPCQRP